MGRRVVYGFVEMPRSAFLLVCALALLGAPALAEQPSKAPDVEARPGTVFRDCPDCPEVVVVPAGTFTMGSPESEQERIDFEGPQRTVAVAQFALGKYEVTRGEWAVFMRESGHKQAAGCVIWNERDKGSEPSRTADWRKVGFPQTDRDPVVCVSWMDAKAYVAWLSKKTGKAYRLPSEAEWEYAARAGAQASRPWGDDPGAGCRHANGEDASYAKKRATLTPPRCDDGHVFTAPVGRFLANRFGLHDMIGNAYEWTEDCWNASYAGAPADGRPWLTGDCTRRPYRGGSWYSAPRSLRSATRFREPNDARYMFIGFRVARSL